MTATTAPARAAGNATGATLYAGHVWLRLSLLAGGGNGKRPTIDICGLRRLLKGGAG